jgi:hypothetical protein
MSGVADRWTALTRSYPLTTNDRFDVRDVVDTPDGFVILLNRTEPTDSLGNSEPDLTFMVLMKISRDGAVLWRIAISGVDPAGNVYQTIGASVSPAAIKPGYYITGTLKKQSIAKRQEGRLFVCRVEEGGFFSWLNTYVDQVGDSALGVDIALVGVQPTGFEQHMVIARGVDKNSAIFGDFAPPGPSRSTRTERSFRAAANTSPWGSQSQCGSASSGRGDRL